MWPGREPEARHPLDGSLVQAAMGGGVALRVDGDFTEAVENQYPALKSEQEAGLRAWLSIPLAHHERPVGALVVASGTLRAYADDHAAFGELVAQALSGVAGAWLWQLAVGARAEDILADLGQVLLSSNLDDGYAALADRLARVTPFDLLVVILAAPGSESATTAFASGAEGAAGSAGETYRVQPGALDALVGVEGRLVTYESAALLPAIAAQWPPLAVEGLSAVAAAPLPTTEGHAGALALATTAPGSLEQSHLAHVRQAAAMLSACVERDALLRQQEPGPAKRTALPQRAGPPSPQPTWRPLWRTRPPFSGGSSLRTGSRSRRSPVEGYCTPSEGAPRAERGPSPSSRPEGVARSWSRTHPSPRPGPASPR